MEPLQPPVPARRHRAGTLLGGLWNNMHIHILGICGTFMGSLAILAREMGLQVSGCDAQVYPPMSTQLQEKGIEVLEGYRVEHLQPAPDLVVIGNALSRGNPCVEYVLDRGLRYVSGPQWLADQVLVDKWVLAVAGTHGKTSTSSMLAWILEFAGMAPGFLIGGVAQNFGCSARLGDTPFFVVEADEYDSAFFDKRSKFVHYRPRTAVLNNLEFDHADIFPNLAAIERQFHHLVRTIPGQGQVIVPEQDDALERVLAEGCWSPVSALAVDQPASRAPWQIRSLQADGGHFELYWQQAPVASVRWSLTGTHNLHNALAAVAAAHHVGVLPAVAAEALACFKGVRRRMEEVGRAGSVTVYDDFAHHPTAIATTLQGVRAQVGDAPVLAVIEPRSNTMRQGAHRERLAGSVAAADRAFWFEPAGLGWGLQEALRGAATPCSVYDDIDALIQAVVEAARPEARIVIMSNGGFGGIHGRLLAALQRETMR